MSSVEEIIKALLNIDEADEQLKEAFYLVRDIPYSTVNSSTIENALIDNRANCQVKAKLLSLIFNKLGYDTRTLVSRYRLKDYPEEVKYIPGQIDYHYVVQVYLNKDWVTVDATYDKPLEKLGFKVNDWNGKTSTHLTEKAIEQKIEGFEDEKFDEQYQDFINKINRAFKDFPEGTTLYVIKFNEWLISAR